MKTISLYTFCLMVAACYMMGTSVCFAEDEEFYQRKLAMLLKNDPKADQKMLARALLKENADDPEAHICVANWFLNLGHNEVSMPADLPQGFYEPELKGTANEKEQGRIFLGSEGYLQDVFIPDETGRQEAIQILENARGRFPQRLDICLGVAQIYDMLGETVFQIAAIEKFVAATKVNGQDLQCEQGRKLPGTAEDFVKEILMELLNDKVKCGSPHDTDIFVAVSRIMVREMPDSVEAWNYLSIACYIRHDALGRYKCLRRALQLAPDDEIVLENWMWANFRLHLWADTLGAANKLLEKYPDSKFGDEAKLLVESITQAMK